MTTLARNRFLAKAEVVRSAIREELERGRTTPGGQPTSEQLAVVLCKVEGMKRQIELGAAPPREAQYRRLSRLLVDEWPLGHPLATAISELEDLYLKA